MHVIGKPHAEWGLSGRRAAEAGGEPPAGHEPQRLQDDAPGELRVAVLAFAERDRHLGQRRTELPGPQDELDLEPVALRGDRLGDDSSSRVLR